MSEIQLVNFQVYIPHFHTDEDKYIDVSPYKPYEKTTHTLRMQMSSWRFILWNWSV